MRIGDIRVLHGDGTAELHAKVWCETDWVGADKTPFEVWYRFPEECGSYLVPENGDPFVAAFLIPSMILGETLRIDGLVSLRLLEAVPTIQAIIRCWNRSCHLVEVIAMPRPSMPPLAPRAPHAGLFFSLGVDSCYSLAKELGYQQTGARTDYLINVLGFDIYLWEFERYPKVLENLRAVAKRFHRKALPVATNLREFSDRVADWVHLYHGSALASIALAPLGFFGTVKIAATHTYAELLPLGSHPILDPLWSTEALEFVHDGCESNRLEKIGILAQEPALLHVLRVCARDCTEDVYNCGLCPKCLMTMVGLHVAGVLERCTTLPHEIDQDRLSAVIITNQTQRLYLEQLRDALGRSEKDLIIRAALTTCLTRPPSNARAPSR